MDTTKSQKVRAFRRWADRYQAEQQEADYMNNMMDGSGECGDMIRRGSIRSARRVVKQTCRQLGIKPRAVIQELHKISKKEGLARQMQTGFPFTQAQAELFWLVDMLKTDTRPGRRRYE